MTDAAIIAYIEKELGVKLKKNDWFRGYSLDENGNVDKLFLSGCEVERLERIASPLRELQGLTTLYLNDNQLTNIAPLRGTPGVNEIIFGQQSDLRYISSQ